MRSSGTTNVRADGVNGTAGAHGATATIDEFRQAPIVERDAHVAERVRDLLLAHPRAFDTGEVDGAVELVRREMFQEWTAHVLLVPGHWSAIEDDGRRMVLWPRWLLRYGTPAGVRAVARLLGATTTEKRR